MNKTNLLKLAEKLEAVSAEQFKMSVFRGNNNGPARAWNMMLNNSDVECGTTACALGWAPTIEGLEASNEDSGWLSYCERVFDIESISNEWDFLFSGQWMYTDNTPLGASRRIRYLIDNDCPSRAHIKTMQNGDCGLCYNNEGGNDE